MQRRQQRYVLLPLLVVPLLALSAGGWAVITVEHLPDYAIAGESLAVVFTVRQHGKNPVRGLEGSVEARAAGRRVRAAVMPHEREGEYAARLVIPESGEWTITIHSGFGNSRLRLLPLSAVTRAAAVDPPTISDAERGRRLFVAKGCATCHGHRDAETAGSLGIGPDLSERRFSPEALGRFLANPAAGRAWARSDNEATMPNVHLQSGEIAALVSFINAERQAHRE